MYTDVSIEAVVLFSLESGKIVTFFISTIAPGDQAMELWCTTETQRYALYHLDAYYDPKLRHRRNSGNMITPGEPKERLVFIADVWHDIPLKPNGYFEITRSCLYLNNVPIDEH